MNILKALGGVDFTKYALLPISQYVQNWLSSKCCKVKNNFFGIKLLHAYLQYLCNILKAIGGVDFTKYALSPISQYVQWSVLAK